MRTRQRQTRGFTLIEMLVSVTIMLTVVAITGVLFVEGAKMTRRGQELISANDASRMAGEAIMNHAQLAGMGAPAGLWVNIGGTATLVNPIYGTNASDGGTDDLWIVVPHPNALRQSCVDTGAATSLTNPGTGLLSVNCVASLADAGATMLMATNMQTGALLTGPFTFVDPSGTTPGTINYAEASVSGFSDSPAKGGFQIGDLVFPVSAVHYFTAVGSDGVRSLMKQFGTRNTSAGGAPFVDTGTATLVQRGIEDLQIAYGVDSTSGTPDPANITFSTATRAWAYSTGLRSLRVSVVAVSDRAILGSNGKPILTSEFSPIAVEGTTPPGAADGKRRTLFSRRVELPNLAPNTL
jgi:prepilin-type N-terminal cleavage/methylation domain-containing protein